MAQRAKRIESMYRRNVREKAESLLHLLAPGDFIDWGTLSYGPLLAYLETCVAKEIEEHKELKEDDE